MEEPTIERGVELLSPGRQIECVPDFEVRIKGAPRRLLLGQTDSGWGSVDSGRTESTSCGKQGVLAGSTTDVEHPAANLAGTQESHESGLGATDVPRRRLFLVGRIEFSPTVLRHESTVERRRSAMRGEVYGSGRVVRRSAAPGPRSGGRSRTPTRR